MKSDSISSSCDSPVALLTTRSVLLEEWTLVTGSHRAIHVELFRPSNLYISDFCIGDVPIGDCSIVDGLGYELRDDL